MATPGSPARVLITGIAGFTGRHLSTHLRQAGYAVIGLGLVDSVFAEATLDADLADTPRIAQWLREQQPTHIVHLAALSHVIGDPLSFFRVNVLGTESLLDAIDLSGIAPRKVLIASSANTYGNARSGALSEDLRPNPMNHYALSKVAMELVVQKWFERLPIIITRPFNYTGVGQSVSFLVPKIVAAFGRRDPVLRLGNTNVARDFSDVAFICEAYARLLRSSAQSTVVNLCSGRSVSITNILDMLTEITGHRPRIEVDPALLRKDEVTELCGDPTRLQALVGPLAPEPLRDVLIRMVSSV
jgi:nucleoside-diphosphate-sugar epimerase